MQQRAPSQQAGGYELLAAGWARSGGICCPCCEQAEGGGQAAASAGLLKVVCTFIQLLLTGQAWLMSAKQWGSACSNLL
jgi:hypothetical protein